MDAGCSCVAGAALGAPQGSFCVAGAALAAPQCHFILQGRYSTRSISREVRGSLTTSEYYGRRLLLRGRCSTWSTSGSFCVAGAALEASQLRIARHFFRAQTIHTTPSTLHHQTQHNQGNTISTTSSTQSHQHNLINTSPSTQHHLHNTIYTTSSTQHHLHYIIKHNSINTHHLHYIIKHNIINTHHLHNTINTTSPTQPHQHITTYITPSTQHHLHYIIKHWQVQHLEHCHITPSASFLLIPLLLFFVVDCSLFSFIDLFHSWMSEGTVNMWGYPVIYFF